MMTTMKVYACNTVKIYKNKPEKIFRGARARRAGPRFAFELRGQKDRILHTIKSRVRVDA